MFQRFVIIDGNSLLHRAWHALPPLSTKTGEVVSAIYGFILIFLKVLKDLKPEYLAVAFDTKAPTFRHQEFKEYKAKRIKQPDEFYRQIPRLKEILESFGIQYLEAPGYEADDIIGTLTRATRIYADSHADLRGKIKNIVVSGDLDTLQLVDEKTKVYTLKKGITETMIYDKKAVKERFGLSPEQLIDFKALRGDPSDNIPGVRGIGEKTALELIKKFGSLENLYQSLEKVEKEKIRNLLAENKEEAFLAQKLVTIKRDLKIDLTWENLKLGKFNKEKIIGLFQELEFKSLLPRVLNLFAEETQTHSDKTLTNADLTQTDADKQQKKSTENEYVLIDSKEKLEKFLTLLRQQPIFALDTETTGLDPFSVRLLGISFSWQASSAYYLPAKYLDLKSEILNLKSILENPAIKKIGHNLKYDLEVLENHGIKLQGISFDTMVAAYLLSPGKRTYGLDLLAFAEFGFQMTNLEELIGKGPSSAKGYGGQRKKQMPMEMIPLEKLAHYSCEDADYTWRLYQKLEPRLKAKGKLWQVFEKIEAPLISVLAKMEKRGLKIDSSLLKKIGDEVKKEIGKLEIKIYELSGQEFNVNSPKQLKEILFEKLKISIQGLGKTKTGVSTAATELKKLKDVHPIIRLISEHRELSKLSSTYLEALPKLISPQTKRIHTSFNQTITATGRLSSSEPNLQNIPARTELGRKIRKAFIAEKGYSIISADYSQIELRIIASLSGDKKMIEFFNQGKDIHLMTAAKIKNVPIEMVTPEMRRLAKTVNFGIIYGLGRSGLAQSANISKQEAAEFIEKYFKVYPEVKEYIEKLKEIAREQGFAETLMGRLRYLPEINSDVQVLRSEAERAAINMPIQGLAADFIKTAMVELDKELTSFGDKVKMILQVHDELVFEIKDENVKETISIIKEIMENPPLKLAVPIKVEIKVGKNWGELKTY